MDTTRRIHHTRDIILSEGVVLSVRLDADRILLDVCRAAVRGGLHIVAVALTTPRALDTIAELARSEDVLVGAATVLSEDDVRRVAEAGAQFTLSPGFDRNVVDEARKRGLLALPGAATPSEILAAHRHGAALVNLFPAGALGGPDYVRAIRGPLASVTLVPSGGPDADSIADYFAAGARAVGVGADVVGPANAEKHDLDEISLAARHVRRAVEAAQLAPAQSR